MTLAVDRAVKPQHKQTKEFALHTVLLLGQLVFCTYALFGTLKLHYECGLVVMVLNSGSDVPTPTICFFSVPEIFFFNYNIHDIFSILIFHK